MCNAMADSVLPAPRTDGEAADPTPTPRVPGRKTDSGSSRIRLEAALGASVGVTLGGAGATLGLHLTDAWIAPTSGRLHG